jgi:hypothetical protein
MGQVSDLDHEVFYMRPSAKGVNKDISMEPAVTTVRDENMDMDPAGNVILQAETGGDLVAVVIPAHLLLGVNTFKRGQETPGYA